MAGASQKQDSTSVELDLSRSSTLVEQHMHQADDTRTHKLYVPQLQWVKTLIAWGSSNHTSKKA